VKRFLHPLLLLLARATEKELVQTIEYLKTENRIMRSKLPKQIRVTPAERKKLLKLGVRLGSKIKEVITIVHPRTFARWLSEAKSGLKPRKRGRPRTAEQIRQLIIDMAKDTGWGYNRIIGELKKLRVYLSPMTIARVLRENGFDPGPKRGHGSWYDFIQRHIKTVWATDFFTKTVWTLRGPVTYYVLFFIHLHTRRVHLAGMTPNPDGIWMAQVARNMSMVFAEEPAEFRPTHIVRDRDSKFTAEFCSILETDGVEFRPIPPRSPNLNPYAEVWVCRTKAECLNHFIVFGEGHLRHILTSWLTYYDCASYCHTSLCIGKNKVFLSGRRCCASVPVLVDANYEILGLLTGQDLPVKYPRAA
jgi:putative transposase